MENINSNVDIYIASYIAFAPLTLNCDPRDLIKKSKNQIEELCNVHDAPTKALEAVYSTVGIEVILRNINEIENLNIKCYEEKVLPRINRMNPNILMVAESCKVYIYKSFKLII